MSIRRKMSDGFVCLVERLKDEGMSEREAERYMRLADTYLGLDTAPLPLKGEKLKQAIRTRLYHFYETYYRPVPFPDRHRTLRDYFDQDQPPWKE